MRLHRRISQDQRIGLKRFKASLNQPREKVVKRRPHLMRVQNQTQKVEGRMAMITSPEGDDPGPGGGGPGPNLPVRYVPEYTVRRTPNGTRYHTDDRCCTLANTRRMERSHWCPTCAWITDAQRYGSVYLTPTGAVAHLDLHCPVLNGPPWIHYPHCQRCSTFPTRRLQ